MTYDYSSPYDPDRIHTVDLGSVQGGQRMVPLANIGAGFAVAAGANHSGHELGPNGMLAGLNWT